MARSFAVHINMNVYSCKKPMMHHQQRNFSTTNGNILGGTKMCPKARETFDVWHETVSSMAGGGHDESKSMNEAKLRERFHNDVKFYPPTYWSEWKGADETLVLLKCVSEVFGDSFKYDRQWLSDDGRDWCLEFEAEIDGDENKKSTVQGVDLVKLDADGKIVEFRVLARPPNAVNMLKKNMMTKVAVPLAKLKAKKAFGFN